MAQLSDRIENVLNEGRMLLLGGQVLLGFSYRICFEPAFQRLPAPARLAEVVSLAVMTFGLGWLLWPVTYHQIAQKGKQTEAVHTFATRVLDVGLFPFAFGLGLSIYPVCIQLGIPVPILFSVAVFCFALLVWYVWTFVARDPQNRPKLQEQLRQQQQELPHNSNEQQQDLSDRIKKVLIECRMALPGAQAFLGFQFSIVFMEAFSRLPSSDRVIHFLSLLSTTISIVLLIAPAAYHRIAEGGRDSEHFQVVASRLLLIALVFLAPGMAGDLLIVLKTVTSSTFLAAAIAIGFLLAFYVLWFGVSWLKRSPAKSV